jgi:hypothetical protein
MRDMTMHPFGPAVADDAKVWSTFADALSVGEITEGGPVRLDVPGLPDTTGTAECNHECSQAWKNAGPVHRGNRRSAWR